jgi:hypothetical protein
MDDEEPFEAEIAVPEKLTDVVTPEVEVPDVYRVSAKEVAKAARDLNLQYIATDGAEAHKVIGQHVAALGVISVGRGLLVRSADQLVAVTEQASKLAGMDGIDDEMKLKLLALASKSADKLVTAAARLMETGQMDRIEDGGGVRLLPAPGQKIVRQKP